MSRQLIINSTPYEVRVAIMENARLVEIYVERRHEHGLAGSIYKGRVTRVLPGMQAAFIDIGLPKAAFLHATDFYRPLDDDDGVALSDANGGHNGAAPELRSSAVSPAVPAVPGAPTAAASESVPPIEERLTKGHEITVQIVKEPIGSKGARVSSNVAIPGRYLVLLPLTQHTGVSRRIADVAERERLLQAVQSTLPAGGGCIIRTASEGVSKRDIQSDLRFLRRLWEQITKNGARVGAPALLHSDLDVILRTLRDHFTADVTRVLIDNRRDYQRALEFMKMIVPHSHLRVELYDRPEPIFDRHGIEAQISKALERKVWLRSGGYIVIDHTEALTAIDVNTGRYVGKTNAEETALHVNLEAARSIVEQLRLRHIGGLIVIDFIDMGRAEHRKQVLHALTEAVRSDKHRTNILGFSELGLVEMTRQRTRENLLQRLCEPCPACRGTAWVKSTATIAHEVLRRVGREATMNGPLQRVSVTVHPAVATFLKQHEHDALRRMQEKLGIEVVCHQASHLSHEQFEVKAVAPTRARQSP